MSRVKKKTTNSKGKSVSIPKTKTASLKTTASANVKEQVQNVRNLHKKWRAQRAGIPRYKTFRLQKKIKLMQQPLPSSWSLIKDSASFLLKNKALFLGITIVYGLAYYLFVRTNTTPSISIGALQEVVDETFKGSTNGTARTATLLGAVLGSPRNSGSSATIATFLAVIASLAYVWAARERINDVRIKVRDVLYQSLAPLLSTLAVLLVISIQLIPFAMATYFYTSARANSLFASGFEDLAFFTLTAFCGLLSFYFVSASIVALYIVTIPGMYPVTAVRAAIKLVKFRRLEVFRRIAALPLLLGVLYFVLLLAVIRFVPNFTYPFIDIYTILIVPFANIYLYKLYRSLI